MQILLALAVLAAIFLPVLAHQVGREVGKRDAQARADVTARDHVAFDVEVAVREAVDRLVKETAADAPLLRRIVREPFERRKLIGRP